MNRRWVRAYGKRCHIGVFLCGHGQCLTKLKSRRAGTDSKAAAWRAKLPAAERAGSHINLGKRLLEAGRHAEAEDALREFLEIRQEALAEGHGLIFNTMCVLGESLAGQGA